MLIDLSWPVVWPCTAERNMPKLGNAGEKLEKTPDSTC
jgi:hypothetical protein